MVIVLIIAGMCSGSVWNNCNLCICVALFRRLNFIVEIDDQKKTWKMVVRVINMWTITRSPKSIVELILVDKKVRLTYFYWICCMDWLLIVVYTKSF